MDENIVEGFARALYVSAYADACGELTGDPNDRSIDCYCCDAEGVGAGEPHFDDCEALELAKAGTPGGGGDWMDTVPATPEHIIASARRILEKIEKNAQTNSRSWSIESCLGACAYEELGTNGYDSDYAREFGHYLAMEYLGHGVTWGDDHPDHNLELGHGECHIADIRHVDDPQYVYVS